MAEHSIYHFKVRAYYPNLNTARFFASDGKGEDAFLMQNYIAPEIEYQEKKDSKHETLKAHFFDLSGLLQSDRAKARQYVQHLMQAGQGNTESQEMIAASRNNCKKRILNKFKGLHLKENRYVIPSSTGSKPDPTLISQKAAILLELIQQLYPVPDFCVLTSETYALTKKERNKHIADAISNLEQMTGSRLGSSEAPLIFAMRCATSCYIPGLLPTYLNTGINETVYKALLNKYGLATAGKIYLSNLQTIYKVLFPENISSEICRPITSLYSITDIEKNINILRSEIGKVEPALLTDLFYQVSFLVNKAHDFFLKNKELIYTLKKEDVSFPALIIQKMVWTIRNDESYPGVLYSRHSRTGLGMQIESVRNMFGDDIMTGSIERTDHEFFDRKEIRNSYPAVFHFVPQLPKLEEEFRSPVTIEFAAETHKNTHLFALLQLNTSELTGRATLLSSIDLFKKNIITGERVINLIQPYHLRQIFSERIDDKSFKEMKFFCRGISVLPRSAVSAKIFFSASKALEAKSKGEKVCLCKDTFIPADTIILKEMDAIISLTPAAVHVVTACLGQGVPALINLQRYMAKIEEQTLVNKDNVVISEGDWITISSKHRMIFMGQALFSPARFHKYLQGHKLDLLPKEGKVFMNMKAAYSVYLGIIKDLDHIEVFNLNDLTKVVRNDLTQQPEKASKLVNKWFDANTDLYIEQILKSELGTHQDQHMLYEFLTVERKVLFFKKVYKVCTHRGIKGFVAGSFMLGRFMCLPHPVKFWRSLENNEIAFLLNEYILFEKYLQVLNDLGERHINRAKTELLKEGINNVNLSHIEPKVFMPLKLGFRQWAQLENSFRTDFDAETLELIHLLQKPYGVFYDYRYEWSLNGLKEICDKEGLAMPEEKMV